MSADDLWCSWCRQPHAPCATTPAMEAERAATLRARLEKRYERPDGRGAPDLCPHGQPRYARCAPCERNSLMDKYTRPERPCTYDPADEEPEGDWTPPRPEPVEYPEEREPCQVCEGGTRYVCCQCAANENNIRRAIRAAIERGDGDKGVSFTFAVTDPIARDVYTDPVTGLLDFPTVAPQGGPDLINPTDILYPCRCGARGIHACPLATRYPSDMFAPVAPPMTPMTPESTARRDAERAHFAKRYPEIMAEVLGVGPDRVAYETTHLAPTVTVGPWFERIVTEAGNLRSYLRTLTNPDAPAEDVAAALDLLTDEDRELVAALTKRNP